jgi:hypothetical protein
MPTKVKSSSIDQLTALTAVSGSGSAPAATLSGYWKLDQKLKGNLNGTADLATKLGADVNLNGQAFNGSVGLTIPVNTTSIVTAGTYYPTFVQTLTDNTNQQAYINSAYKFNAATGKLDVTSIGTASWAGAIIGAGYGGTGVDNGTRTLTISTNSGTISFTNASTTLTVAANASVSGTHSGTSSGTNTGDQTLSGLGGAALSGATFTGAISATNLSGTNTGDQDLSNYVQKSTSPTFTGVSVNGGTGGDTGGVFWFQPGYSSNQIFKTYQRSDNVLVTRYGSFGAGTGAYADVFSLDSTGNVTVPGNVTAYSDITLKDNIEIIPNALNKVTQTRGVTYTRTDLEDKLKRHTGVIAQEIESVLPEAVMTDANGIKSVAYGNVIGLLIEAIKELDNKVDSLQKQLDEKNND